MRFSEDFAGQRYGLDAVETVIRLYAIMPQRMVDMVEDARRGVDLMVRLSATWLVATTAALILLTGHGYWPLLATVTFVLAWISYEGAIAVARGYGDAIASAIDLYRVDLLEQMRLGRPSDSKAEMEASGTLRVLLRDRRGLDAFGRVIEWRDRVDPSGDCVDASNPADL